MNTAHTLAELARRIEKKIRELIPEADREMAKRWIEEGQPHPDKLSAFFKAVLSDSLSKAGVLADSPDRVTLYSWALWLNEECPPGARGEECKLLAWHRIGGLRGYAARASTEPAPPEDEQPLPEEPK